MVYGTHSSLDEQRWVYLNELRCQLMKDRSDYTSLFSQLRQAISQRDYPLISKLQLEIEDQMKKIKNLYNEYKRNLF